MKAKFHNQGLKATLVVVLGSLILTAGFMAVPASQSANAASAAIQVSSDWTHLGGDPLFPGGLTKIAHDQGISLRQAFVYAVTSGRGQTALRYAGLSSAERSSVTLAARMGMFHACRLNYGMSFLRMSFGINGTSVDRNVTFRDPRYRKVGAAAFCMDVPVGSNGPVVHILVPVVCVNIAVINRTHPPKPKPIPKPKPGKSLVIIVKHALDETGELIRPTPTSTFRFKVQCGLKGKPRFIVVNQTNEPAGYCSWSSGRVLVWELKPLGNDNWIMRSPVYQTFKLKGRKVITVVYKDQQAKPQAPPPPTTTTTVVTTTTTPTTTTPPTTTTQPKSNTDLCTNEDQFPGIQTAIPNGATRNTDGTCTWKTTTSTPTTTTTQPKSNTDLCTNEDQFPGIQTAIPHGATRNTDGTCTWNSTTSTSTSSTTTTSSSTSTTTTTTSSTVDLCINIDGTQSQSDVNANYTKDPPDAGVPGNCYPK